MNRDIASNNLLVFVLEDQQYGLHLSTVEGVIRAAEVTRLPRAPEIVTGLLNVRGQIYPVVNTRRRFHLPERNIDPGDRFVLAHTPKFRVALAVDQIEGIITPSESKVIRTVTIDPGLKQIDGVVKGVVKLESGILLIYDLEKLLSSEKAEILEQALEGAITNR